VRLTRTLPWLLSALTLTMSQAAAAAAQRPRVVIAAGALQGTLAAGAPGAVFKGIPFARPPVGPLRWRAPLPAVPWRGVRDAAHFSPACMQGGRGGPTGSEDCLYLNVWTPEWPARSRHPVMLWLFGGANAVGSASDPTLDGASLARHGVVVVTANYRPGVMGFMAHPALSAESPHGSSGNYALLDQLLALRWIRENIGRFGGDPHHVTLFGQSSGAFDVMVLMTSPLARGLFVDAIAESGQLLSFGGPMPKARAERIGLHIAADLHAPPGAAALGYLRGLPAAAVGGAAAKWLPADIDSREHLDSDNGLLTNVDGWVLPDSPARVFAAHREMPIPLIVGNNAREITPNVALDRLRSAIATRYGDLAPKALEAYGLANGGTGHPDPLRGGPGAQWMTDIVQRCAAILESDWHAAAGHPTWEYQFERTLPGKEAAGSTHGAEVAFVFGTLHSAPGAPAFTASDRAASRQMQEYWARFAIAGDPNGAGLPFWPRAGDGHYLAFTERGLRVAVGLESEPCAVYREWIGRRLAAHSP